MRAFNTFGRESVEGALALTTQRLRVYLLGLSVLLGLIAAGYGMGAVLEPNRAQNSFYYLGSVLGLAVVATVAFLALGRVRFDFSQVRRVDAAVTLGVAAILQAAFLVDGWGVRPWGSVVYPIALIVLARGALVPSTSARTLALSAAALAPPAIAWIAGQIPGLVALSSPAAFAVPRIGLIAWSFAAIAVSAALSEVLHGGNRRRRLAEHLGPYRLVRKLSVGGMGTVYEGQHEMLPRPVAIKVMRPEQANDDGLERFAREVAITSQLTHPNTVTVHDFGRTPDGGFYYVMEYLDGIDLELLLREHGPQQAARVVSILAQVCGSLVEAHQAGLIHRDIKPANIMTCRQGGMHDVVKVVDFGLAKAFSPHAGTDQRNIVGTPHYMAPETIREGATVDARADLYALGAVAYELLVGEPVFDSDSPSDVLRAHLKLTPVPPSLRSSEPIPPALEALVLSCLAKDPSMRPASARALQNALVRLQPEVGFWTEERARAWWASHMQEHDVRTKVDRVLQLVPEPASTLDVRAELAHEA